MRGASGLSLVVGVNKPRGMSSHDVVNRCRKIFGERRVGHTGTLDPMASGVLPICVGPATRLDNYLVGHDKTYKARIAFGVSTTTEDACGDVVLSETVLPLQLSRPGFARQVLETFTGTFNQLPPAYSAIKVGGKKACDEARKGTVIALEPRRVTVTKAELLGLGTEMAFGQECPYWDVCFEVSKGTYIRSLARDIGIACASPAHLSALERTSVGALSLQDCVSLEALEDYGPAAALDPISLLGYRLFFARDDLARRVDCGNQLRPADVELFTMPALKRIDACACTTGIRKSCNPLTDGEILAAVKDHTLQALYRYNESKDILEASCVFQIGVTRGCVV